MHTVTFCSFKGGTAKTSASLNVAAILAKIHQKRVLLIDSDSQSNLSTGIGVGPDCLAALPAVLKGEKTLQEVIQKTSIPGLEVVPANIFLDGIEATAPIVNDLYGHERLKKALKTVDYDYCFIDTPPSLGWLTQSAFFASSLSIICLTPEPYSLLGLKRLKEYHEAIQENHTLSCLGIIMSFWDAKGATNRAFLETIESFFPHQLFQTKIRRDIAINRAILQGKPIIETDKSARASLDYQALTKELLKRIQKAD
ncbi:MAG: chlamydia virulence plasmid protein pGP5-D [Chlamydiales bacterium]|jgi:chromosome partitioning protein|nr:chlamydia virulence plasmid protein pGP5-D [Chlamydiales bacterium]